MTDQHDAAHLSYYTFGAELIAAREQAGEEEVINILLPCKVGSTGQVLATLPGGGGGLHLSTYNKGPMRYTKRIAEPTLHFLGVDPCQTPNSRGQSRSSYPVAVRHTGESGFHALDVAKQAVCHAGSV